MDTIESNETQYNMFDPNWDISAVTRRKILDSEDSNKLTRFWQNLFNDNLNEAMTFNI